MLDQEVRALDAIAAKWERDRTEASREFECVLWVSALAQLTSRRQRALLDAAHQVAVTVRSTRRVLAAVLGARRACGVPLTEEERAEVRSLIGEGLNFLEVSHEK